MYRKICFKNSYVYDVWRPELSCLETLFWLLLSSDYASAHGGWLGGGTLWTSSTARPSCTRLQTMTWMTTRRKTTTSRRTSQTALCRRRNSSTANDLPFRDELMMKGFWSVTFHRWRVPLSGPTREWHVLLNSRDNSSNKICIYMFHCVVLDKQIGNRSPLSFTQLFGASVGQKKKQVPYPLTDITSLSSRVLFLFFIDER